MLCLGIESTAHTFACAVVGKNGKIHSDVRKIYRPPEGEGIHPREASRHHIESSANVLVDSLQQARIKINDLDIIAYAAGPGLGPCLRVGAVVARSLSSYYKIPLYPVHHAIGHIDLGKLLTGAKNPLVLLVSGGHTMLLAFMKGKWRVFGETLDITLGQLLDQFGRSIGFASPCGKNIEELAAKTSTYIQLPYVVKGNDVSFSGLLSATKSISSQKEKACFSLQETAFAMISEATERALSFTKKKELMIVGGVAANKRLSDMLKSICKRQNCKFYVVPQQFAGDCGPQIAWTGLLEATAKKGSALENTFVRQSWRLDSVNIDY
jgi:N6-L-threonylcarbamoyladenine synthase